MLVETGSQSSVDELLAALDGLGVSPTELAGIAVTHIHLDHAGGVGDVARAFPNATVYVHERGARHLVDPSRLVASAATVYGDLLDSLYGRLDPTPAERVHVLADGEAIAIGGGRTLTTVDSPGHAKHHLALHDSESGILFAGDAVGVRLPDAGILRPATPPPDFDLDQALHSLDRFAERRPAGIALAHFGLVPDPGEILEEAHDILRRWAEVAEAAWREDRDIAAALDAEDVVSEPIGDVSTAEGLDAIADLMASAVAQNGVIAIYQGAAETGPRALGHRSILANPCDAAARERLNERVKYREAIRPLAPMATLEAAIQYFELMPGASDADYNAYNYMVLTAHSKPGAREKIPAVIHADGTGRIQTVAADGNPRFHALISEFARQTGVPVLLNTSFNRQEPIVASPAEAVSCFLRTKMDALALGNRYIAARKA